MKTLSKVLGVFLVLALTGGMVLDGVAWGARYESKFYGTVEIMPEGIDGIWVVNGKEVLVTKETVVKEKHGKAAVGAYVEIEGNLSGKTFTAYEIEVKRALSEQPVGRETITQPTGSEIRISGKVERIPDGLLGTWVVNGREIFVSKDTVIKERQGKTEVGVDVEILGIQTGKVLHAYRIDVRNTSVGQPAGGDISIFGKVERIPEGLLGTWIISGKEVFVSKDTMINEEFGKAGVGVNAEVTGSFSGKTFHAYRIDIRKDKK